MMGLFLFMILFSANSSRPTEPWPVVYYTIETRDCLYEEEITVGSGALPWTKDEFLRFTPDGKVAKINPLCVDGKMKYLQDRYMRVEEFKWKYDHDPAFKDSISSYSFR